MSPRVLLQVVLDSKPDALVISHPVSIDHFLGLGALVEVLFVELVALLLHQLICAFLLYVKVALNSFSLVCLTTLDHHRIGHQDVGEFADQVLRRVLIIARIYRVV